MAINYVPTFRAASEYERQQAEARRREALAQALESQAYQPLSGSAAPTPSAAPLVMALQSYLSARQRRKGQEAEEKARQADIEGVERLRQELKPEQRIMAPANEQIAASVGMPQVSETGEVTYGPAQQAPLRTDMVGPTAAERRSLFAQYGELGTPSAQRLAKALASMEPEEQSLKIGNIDPSKFTPASVAAAQRTGDISLLSPIEGAPEAVTPTTIVKNGRRIVVDARTGREIGAAPETSPLVVNYGQPVAGVDEKGNPVFFQPSKGGGAPAIVPNVRPAPKEMNENQAKAAGFADRIAEASPALDVPPPSVGTAILSNLPGGNFMLDPNQQSFYQAERNFINAVLRRESGAVISDEEFANARKQYIPQPGDSPQVLEQKRRNRETVKRSMMRDAGPSYQPVIDLPAR